MRLWERGTGVGGRERTVTWDLLSTAQVATLFNGPPHTPSPAPSGRRPKAQPPPADPAAFHSMVQPVSSRSGGRPGALTPTALSGLQRLELQWER